MTLHQKLVKTVTQWAEINSWSHNPIGLAEMLAALEAAFSVLNPQRLHTPGCLHLKCRPDAPVQVLLGGHYDTVYPPGTFDQVTRDGDLLRGPGVTDMKGGLVVMLEALKNYEQSPGDLGWEVLITPDEELGSPSSRTLWEEAAKRNHYGLIFESSKPDGAFISARKSSCNFTVVAHGIAAHAGREREKGKSAIAALAKLIAPLEALGVNVGTVEGGTSPNVVPDHAKITCNVRAATDRDMAAVWEEIKALTADCEVTRLTFRPAKPFDQKCQNLFNVVKECGKGLGLEIKWHESGGVTDGNFLVASGLPTVDTMGVCGDNIHSTDEYMIIESLEPRIALTIELLKRLERDGSNSR